MCDKVTLLVSKPHFWLDPVRKPLKKCLSYYQPEGDGYVHRVRKGHMYYDRTTGEYTHTGLSLWCGQIGIVGSVNPNKRRVNATLVANPSAGRIVCATCAGRAVGAGQAGSQKIAGKFVKYRPHDSFYGSKPKENDQ